MGLGIVHWIERCRLDTVTLQRMKVILSGIIVVIIIIYFSSFLFRSELTVHTRNETNSNGRLGNVERNTGLMEDPMARLNVE